MEHLSRFPQALWAVWRRDFRTPRAGDAPQTPIVVVHCWLAPKCAILYGSIVKHLSGFFISPGPHMKLDIFPAVLGLDEKVIRLHFLFPGVPHEVGHLSRGAGAR